MMLMDSPMMKPAITVLDMKFATQPSRARPAAMKAIPVKSASAAEMVTAVSDPPLAFISATRLAEMAAVDDDVASTRMVERPKSA
jgi:hypothetical protein